MTRERYESISLHDLREIAKNRGMRRISTLKKADLIDEMLKKDEEEARILREEKFQRRQELRMQQEREAAEAAQQSASGEAAGQDPAGQKPAGQTASGQMAAGQAAGGAGDGQTASRRNQRGGRAAGEEGRQDSEKARDNVQGDGARTGGPRNRLNAGTGVQNGRRQSGRQRRDDRQQPQGGRQQGRDQRRDQQSQTQQSQAQSFQSQQVQQSRQGAQPGMQSAGQTAGPGSWTGVGGAGIAAGEPAPVYQYDQSEAGRETARPQETGRYGSAPARPQEANRYGSVPARPQEANRYGSAPAAADPAGQAQADGQQEASRLSRMYQPGRPDTPVFHKDELNADLDSGQMANGILEVMQDGFGFIRCANYMPGENDIYVAPSQIRRFGLKTGDIIVGNIRVKTQGEKFSALLYVKSVNGFSPEEANRRYNFEDMTPVFPDERIRLERAGGTVSMRIMDLMCPVGKGQRGMIVSPPKAGKTTLIKEVARSVKYNNPEIHLIVLLIDERPEEVTDIREAIEGPNAEVIYSTFDELPEHHKRVSEMVIERARRLVEHKKDVMILLDSITRLTRAYNITEPSSGRTLSGGLDPAALHMPKRFFGAARNMREGGSLTILATALIDTGSKMDDIVFEEFKGTGNMELVLDRRLSERRIFPAIDIVRSGTRRDDLLLTPDELTAINTIRRAFNGMTAEQAVTQALDLFSKTRTNGEFVNMVRKIQWGKTD